MSSEDKIRKWLEFRRVVEDKIRELEKELDFLKNIKELIDDYIKSHSIITADRLVFEKNLGSLIEVKNVKSRSTGELLAKIEIYEKGLIIKPLVSINVDTSVFKKFFKEKVLEKLRREDLELVKKGELSENEVLNYNVKTSSEGEIEEIIIENYRDEERLREIMNSIRWTLEKVES